MTPTDHPHTHVPSRRIAHLTTVDMSLALLLGTELMVDVEKGHEVFGISTPGPYVPRVEALGVRHVPIASLSREWGVATDLKAFVELVRTLRALDLDVLHTHNPKTGVMGRIAGRVARVPVVVNTCHGLWARPEDSLKKRPSSMGSKAWPLGSRTSSSSRTQRTPTLFAAPSSEVAVMWLGMASTWTASIPTSRSASVWGRARGRRRRTPGGRSGSKGQREGLA